MSTSVIESRTSTVEKVEEQVSEQTTAVKSSPWETLDHQPGAFKTKGGNKLLTIEDALKKPNKSGANTKNLNNSFKQSKIEHVSVSLKKDDEEQWNPVDLTHLLITDAAPKPEKNSNGKFKNGGSKRKPQNLKSERAKTGNKNSSKKENKDKTLRGDSKKQGSTNAYKKNTLKVNENAKHETSSGNEEIAVENETKDVSKSELPAAAIETDTNENNDASHENAAGEHAADSELKQENENKFFKGEYQQKLSPHYKGKKPFHEGFTKYQKKPYNQSYNNENKRTYEKRSYQPRAFNRYNNSYHNRSYSHHQSQQPIILPIYQKQFPYNVYDDCAKQIAYYLSEENLEKDEFLVKTLMDKSGYVQLSQLLNFKKLRQLSENGNFEIVMTALFIILSQQLAQANDIEVALLDNMSEYIASDAYGNKNPYDCYILRNLKWTNKCSEENPRVFNVVTAFGVNDFLSYSIQKPVFLEEAKSEQS